MASNNIPSDLDSLFDTAIKRVSSSHGLSNETLLELYGLFKTATVGKCDTKRPGMFDFVGRSKWDRWCKISSQINSLEAKQRYIKLVKEVEDASIPTKSSSAAAHFVHVSTMSTQEPAITSSTQIETPLDAVQLGDLKALQAMYRDNQSILSFRTEDEDDGSGGAVSLLHFAADCGNIEIVNWLINEVGMGVNVKDGMGQTPLFYAIVCRQTAIIRLLTELGASWDIEDKEGLTPKALALEEELNDLIPS